MNEESEARMEKKIIGIMLTLVVVAVVVMAAVLIAAGGLKRGGGFSNLFDSLEYDGELTYSQDLAVPDDWEAGDVKTVSDQIVDLFYYRHTYATTTVYITTLYFTYIGDKWTDPTVGTRFYVPTADADGDLNWLQVNHGMFSIQVSSATNLSASYSIGDIIDIDTTLIETEDGPLAFGEWAVSDTI